MAFSLQRKNPLEDSNRRALGVSLPFSGRAVFNSTYTSKDVVKSNLLNFFLTGNGERFLNPEFGSGLRNSLFENITENQLTTVKRTIEEELKLFFPRVIVNELSLESNPDTNSILLYFKYSVRDTNIEDEIIINFD